MTTTDKQHEEMGQLVCDALSEMEKVRLFIHRQTGGESDAMNAADQVEQFLIRLDVLLEEMMPSVEEVLTATSQGKTVQPESVFPEEEPQSGWYSAKPMQ